ncbi:self-incompatibility protein S1-like [Andrographis paniculata]|uniref:self-incompatibility protein S1-like n=1 Tax=Andrographis paniculata TaxID=175694 RepID=UPI0021E99521|nr:self-incompatibility protein S1-like [Andrographis paniculata]
MLVHCASGDNDLGYHNLTVNQDFHFSFCQADRTLFFCRLTWGAKIFLHIAFDVTTAIGDRSCTFSGKYQVHVVNNLPPNSVMLVHCASGDNDLGYHNLTVNQDFRFSFCQADRTLFFCRLTWGAKSKGFEVYNTQWKDQICTSQQCYWAAKSDGIYFSGTYPPYNLVKKYSW